MTSLSSPNGSMVTSPCISSSSLDMAFFGPTITTNNNNNTSLNNNNYISSTTTNNNNIVNSNNNSFGMLNSFPHELLFGANMGEVTCSEVSSSCPFPSDFDGCLDSLSDPQFLPAATLTDTCLSSPDALDSTCLTLANLRPHSAYSDVSSVSGNITLCNSFWLIRFFKDSFFCIR